MTLLAEEIYTEEDRRFDLDSCINSLFYLGKHILGYEDAEIVPHADLCEFIESKEKRKLLVGARGIYKTSFGTVGRSIQLILRDPNIRILIVQNVLKNAQMTVSEIKDQFENNEKLRRLRPEIIPVSTHRIPWSTSALVFNRTKIYREPTVMAAGVGADLASLHFDYILGDDVVAAGRDDMKEGGLIILRPEDVDKAIGWYKITMRGLEIKRKGHQTEVQFIVNRWGVNDFARYIMDNHLKSKANPGGFVYKEMAAHKEDGSLLWSSVMDEAYLEQARSDMLDFMYFTQMECKPYNPSDRGFPPEFNMYWDGELPPEYEKRKYNIFALMDTADVTKQASCNSSFVVLWVDENNHIWVGEAIRGKMDPVNKIALIHRMVRKYQLKKVYIEENLHNETMRFMLKDAMKKDDIHYRIEPLKHKNRNKDARILRLQPHHECGALHIKKNQKHLREELRDFPFSPHKDIIDALGYIMDFIKGPPKKNAVWHVNKVSDDYITVKQIKESIAGHKANIYGGGPYRHQSQRRFPRLAI